jgi:alpha-aminoadipate carrier protein LysW
LRENRNWQTRPAQNFLGKTLDLFLTKKLNITGTPNAEENMVYCPECETDLDIDEDEVDEGAVVSCPECGTDFEVVTEDADDEEDEDEDS